MSDCLRWQHAQHRDPVFLGAITWNGLASLMLFGWMGSTVLTQSKSRVRGLPVPGIITTGDKINDSSPRTSGRQMLT